LPGGDAGERPAADGAKRDQDRECLMREASALSASRAAGGDPTTQARVRAYGQAAAACECQQGKAREACQAEARRNAGGGEEEPDDVVETPYLMFTGCAGCKRATVVKIDNRVEGSFNDVQNCRRYRSSLPVRPGGLVVFVSTASAFRHTSLLSHSSPSVASSPMTGWSSQCRLRKRRHGTVAMARHHRPLHASRPIIG